MKIKKALIATVSVALCLSIILGIALPMLLGLSPAVQADAIHTVRIEAENAYWNGYQVTKTSTVAANATVIGNAATTHTYATWSELSAMKLNKNIHIYVAFCVEVPQAGTYQISTGNVVRMSKSSTPYAAIVVNPQYNGKAYKLTYKSVDTNATYCVSNAVEVQLQKGRNMIYMTPFTGDQSINWADADYIEITGDHAVRHIAPASPVAVAANAGGIHKFATISADALAGANLTAAKGLTAASITRADLASVPHVSYTVTAPADGYYDISLKYSTSASNTSADYAFALLVDNRAAEIKPIHTAGGSTADISTYLTKGTHVLTIPIILPRTDKTKTVYWTDLKGLILNNGLTLSDQYNSLAMGTQLETETYAFAWRYPTVSENSGRLLVGGSQPGMVKQTYDQLASGAKLDKNQPMFTYQVDVLTAGTYTLNVSYRDYTDSDYYMIVSVDDTTYTKAVYTGDDPNYSNRRIATATLNLTEGRHFIRLVTLPGDSKANWIDVDYAAFNGPCPVIGVKNWAHLQSANATAYQGFTGITDSHSAYGPWWNHALSGYQGNSMAANAGVTTGSFVPSDLAHLGWASYRVHVPEDGFYDMQTYLHPNPNTSGTGKVLLGIEKIDANLINQAQGVIALNYTGDSSGWWDLEGDYKAFSVTARNYLPMAQSAEGLGQPGYSMVLRVTMDNGKFYAFRIVNDESVRYAYSRYGANGSSSGWDGTTWLDETSSALIGSIGAKFKVERTNDNTLTVSLDGKVLDTFTMDGITADNKVVSVGFRQFGNPENDAYQVEIPFEFSHADDRVNIEIPGIQNGTVTTEKDRYKVGDTVVLNISANDGFSQKLTLNGKPILLDWKTGKFSYVATNEVYDIEGTFEKILWNNIEYRWVDVRLDIDAQKWWIADLSSFLTEGDYIITVSGLMDYTGSSNDWCDLGALTISGGITAPGLYEEEPLTNVTTKLDNPGSLFYRNDNLSNLPDPFVLDNTAQDGYYYLYGTWGAFRCFRSKNMMDWEDCGEVLKQYRENNKVWDSVNQKYSYQVLGGDLWAPEVVYDAETKLYYMFFSATPDLKGYAAKGNSAEMLMAATSTSPTGPFNLVNFKNAGSCGAENVHTYSTSTYTDYFAPYLLLDPAQNRAFSEKINGEWRGANNGGYVGNIDAHPYVAPDGTKYLYWVDSKGADRICGVEMENWLKPKWETAQVLTYHNYYTVSDRNKGANNPVSYENYTTSNEGPFVTYHNGKYYLTYSANNWKNNSYLVAQAIADSPLGPYTKLKESEGGVLLSGMKQGSQTSSGTGHHSMLQVGNQLLMIYHRHNDPSVAGSSRNHAIDEVKWITIGGREVMYVNGPNVTLQPRIEMHSLYHNIADEAKVSSSGNAAVTYLNDGLLSHLKNGHANVVNAVGETTISSAATFTFSFDKARSITAVMVYNSRLESRIFRQIKQIRLVCIEDGKTVIKYIDAVPFNAEYYETDSSGKVTYAEPCAAAYAVFAELQVLSVEITVDIPAGQSSVGISEIRILGK